MHYYLRESLAKKLSFKKRAESLASSIKLSKTERNSKEEDTLEQLKEIQFNKEESEEKRKLKKKE